MTSDISVTTTAYQVERRGWLWGAGGTHAGDNPGVTLDISTFTAGTHYPNGYIPSGTVVVKITASGLYGPYDSGATDGRQTLSTNNVGLLFSSVAAVQPSGVAKTRVGAAILIRGNVDPLRLPFQSGSGAAVAAVRTALPLIYWS